MQERSLETSARARQDQVSSFASIGVKVLAAADARLVSGFTGTRQSEHAEAELLRLVKLLTLCFRKAARLLLTLSENDPRRNFEGEYFSGVRRVELSVLFLPSILNMIII